MVGEVVFRRVADDREVDAPALVLRHAGEGDLRGLHELKVAFAGEHAALTALGQDGSATDIAVAGFRAVGNDAESDQSARCGKLSAFGNGALKGTRISNDVIGRHYQQHRVALPVRSQCKWRRVCQANGGDQRS